MSSDNRSWFTRTRDRIAKRIWSGEVSEQGGIPMSEVSRPGLSASGWKRTRVSKADNGRRGQVSRKLDDPIKGESRPFNPYSTRQLAESETIQSIIQTILGDIDAVPWSVVPLNESTTVASSTLDDAEAALNDINPNPETFVDVNQMFCRDLLEVGNCVATLTENIDGRSAEAVPLDPGTFTVEWNTNRILERFYQYPQEDNAKWGDPIPFEVEEVLWGIYNPTTRRSGFYGYSPVEQVEMTINIMGGLVEKEVTEIEEGMPSGLITLQGDTWNRQNYENFKEYWQENVKGHQLSHPVAEGDADFVPFNMTYKELQVLDRQQWYAKLVGSVFGVPMSETGLAIGETMNRATDVSQRQRYKQKTLQSLLEQLEDLWTYQYLHRFFSEDIRLKFDVGRDLMEKETLSKIHKTQLDSGLRTINEIREEQGLEDVEWGDEPFSLNAFTKQQSQPATPPGTNDGQLETDQTPEEANQNALTEGLEQNQTPTQNGERTTKKLDAVSGADKWRGEGTWLPEIVEAPNDEQIQKSFRGNDEWRQYSFQPSAINDLEAELTEYFGETIEDVMNQLRGNQDLLRDPSGENPVNGLAQTQKSVSGLMRLIREQIGLDFAENVASILAEHKATQVFQAEDAILNELAQAGVSTEDLDLSATRDRVVERIQNRTMEITRPISERLESGLRDVFTNAWNEDWRITKIEEEIQTLREDWTGYHPF
jgi:HK97 family phage portal protein